ncbi:MAG TPA: IclR family transcriptional regulator [Lacipirellulaceae bacterium]|nr:IclR family transcriptional regulator [Lacipirellulaceae bacterium]
MASNRPAYAAKPKLIRRSPITKALRLLNWLIETSEAEVGVRQMAAALRLSPSNAHQLLTSLLAEGYVQRDPDSGRYSLGLELLRWAHRIVGRIPLRTVALPQMQALVEACNETVFLGVYDPTRREMMFAASVESMHPLRYVIELNRWFPVTAGASGLSILAFLPDAEIDTVLKKKLVARTPTTIVDPKRLRTELSGIRKRGYAISRGQREPGAVGIGAPIFDHDAEVVGDIVITSPEQRYDRRKADMLGRLVRSHADFITRDLGGRYPKTPR